MGKQHWLEVGGLKPHLGSTVSGEASPRQLQERRLLPSAAFSSFMRRVTDYRVASEPAEMALV